MWRTSTEAVQSIRMQFSQLPIQAWRKEGHPGAWSDEALRWRKYVLAATAGNFQGDLSTPNKPEAQARLQQFLAFWDRTTAGTTSIASAWAPGGLLVDGQPAGPAASLGRVDAAAALLLVGVAVVAFLILRSRK